MVSFFFLSFHLLRNFSPLPTTNKEKNQHNSIPSPNLSLLNKTSNTIIHEQQTHQHKTFWLLQVNSHHRPHSGCDPELFL